MKSRSMLALMVAWLLGLLLALCSEDGKPEAVDPCPGWPFQINARWTYFDINSYKAYRYWTADSIVEIGGKKYIRIQNEAEPCFVRCSGDSVYWIDEFGEYLRWVFDANPGTSWLRIIRDINTGQQDTVLKIELSRNDIRILDGIALGCYARVYNRYSYEKGKFNTSSFCKEIVCKEYGLVERDCPDGSYNLISYCPSKK